MLFNMGGQSGKWCTFLWDFWGLNLGFWMWFPFINLSRKAGRASRTCFLITNLPLHTSCLACMPGESSPYWLDTCLLVTNKKMSSHKQLTISSHWQAQSLELFGWLEPDILLPSSNPWSPPQSLLWIFVWKVSPSKEVSDQLVTVENHIPTFENGKSCDLSNCKFYLRLLNLASSEECMLHVFSCFQSQVKVFLKLQKWRAVSLNRQSLLKLAVFHLQ